jgi:hypothetical protein
MEQKRDKRGRFARKGGIILFLAIVAVAFFLVWFIPLKQEYNKVSAETATSTEAYADNLEAFIKRKTKERMEQDTFKVEMERQARKQIIEAVQTRAETMEWEMINGK